MDEVEIKSRILFNAFQRNHVCIQDISINTRPKGAGMEAYVVFPDILARDIQIELLETLTEEFGNTAEGMTVISYQNGGRP